jgi:ACS family hexuronate transporter-like MFS transporter
MPSYNARMAVPGKSRWVLCILLFLATTLNYLDRQTLGILAPILQKDLGIDNAALGWLFSVFYYTYTFAQFAVGPLLDRWHLRWAYGLAVLAWSATGALTALSRTFVHLLGFRLALGITESANWPAAMRIVARLLPPGERALGNGIFTSGTSVGALIAPALVLGLAHWWGWRAAFIGVGSLGALWFVVWAWFSGRSEFAPVWKEERPAGSAAAAPRVAYGEILRMPQFWRVFAVAVLVNPCLYFNVNWLPTYFVQQRGMDAGKELGAVLTAIYLGLDLGYLFCGSSVLWMTRRGAEVAVARRRVFLLATVLVGLSAVAPLAKSTMAAVAALVVVNFGIGIWIAMYLTMAQEVSEKNVSTAAGLLGGSGSLAGALAMWAVGQVTQQTGSFLIPMAAVSVAVAVAAMAGLAVTKRRTA